MIIDSTQYNGMCACGRKHKMETVLSVVGCGCLREFDRYASQLEIHGCRTAVYDENTYRATADRHPTADHEIVLSPVNLHADEHGVDLLLEKLPEDTDILIAMGSGTVHDIVRYCAYQKGLTFISCPTAASVDGFCSSVAAMTWHGCKKTLTAVAPKMVIADIDVIKNAPIRLARSGFGDMIGKYVALTDWKIASHLTGEFYCNRIADMTADATRQVLESANGIAAAEDEAYTKLMYGLLLSGLAMQMMGNSRPASGAEHHISHLIEMHPESLGVHSDALHGEKVGVGTLLAIREYQAICQDTSVTFRDYVPYSADQIVSVFDKAMAADIIAENEKDAADGITAERLRDCLDEIRREILAMPDADSLGDVYQALGVKSTLEDIGVSPEILPALLDNSPMVRNRLTFMRLRKCIVK
ncbi:MAG: sn-glycerol-1-phosphate dehydrogenase [Clostridia bacterium]|nr:sn-glycerol-1-phosphate dehydrogenase [Clostridia bacterium]